MLQKIFHSLTFKELLQEVVAASLRMCLLYIHVCLSYCNSDTIVWPFFLSSLSLFSNVKRDDWEYTIFFAKIQK